MFDPTRLGSLGLPMPGATELKSRVEFVTWSFSLCFDKKSWSTLAKAILLVPLVCVSFTVNRVKGQSTPVGKDKPVTSWDTAHLRLPTQVFQGLVGLVSTSHQYCRYKGGFGQKERPSHEPGRVRGPRLHGSLHLAIVSQIVRRIYWVSENTSADVLPMS